MKEFKAGDKIIWDSGFGYELGYFVGEGVMHNTWSVNLITGCSIGQDVSFDKSEIFLYSDEEHQRCKQKYQENPFLGYPNVEI